VNIRGMNYTCTKKGAKFHLVIGVKILVNLKWYFLESKRIWSSNSEYPEGIIASNIIGKVAAMFFFLWNVVAMFNSMFTLYML
jgi:hypothetical protein